MKEKTAIYGQLDLLKSSNMNSENGSKLSSK